MNFFKTHDLMTFLVVASTVAGAATTAAYEFGKKHGYSQAKRECDDAIEDVKRHFRDQYFKEAASQVDEMVKLNLEAIGIDQQAYQKLISDYKTKTDDTFKEGPTDVAPDKNPTVFKKSTQSKLDEINAEHHGEPFLITPYTEMNSDYSVERYDWYPDDHVFIDEYGEKYTPAQIYSKDNGYFPPWVLGTMDLYPGDDPMTIVQNDNDLTIYEVHRKLGHYVDAE